MLAAGLGWQPMAAQAATAGVFIVATGDIACDNTAAGPGVAVTFVYAAYNSGNGSKDGCRRKAVGDAVIAAKPDQFWALGDNQYFDGTYAKCMAVYDKAFEVQTNVILGNVVCFDNVPAAQVNAADGGELNQVSGQKKGECAGL
jgi:hypothetical protein